MINAEEMQKVFEQFCPKSDALFATSDDQLYINEATASVHADTLPDPTVTEWHNGYGSLPEKTVHRKNLQDATS